MHYGFLPWTSFLLKSMENEYIYIGTMSCMPSCPLGLNTSLFFIYTRLIGAYRQLFQNIILVYMKPLVASMMAKLISYTCTCTIHVLYIS